MAQIAIFTFGVLVGNASDERVVGFYERIESVFQRAEKSAGYIKRARAVKENPDALGMDDHDYGQWGAYISPKYYTGDYTFAEIRGLQTLSLWRDLESVFQFAYFNEHGEALKHRHEWNEENDYPAYILWWVNADDPHPTWAEACKRYEHLYENGVSPYAFGFAAPYDAQGNRVKVDKKRPITD